MDNLQAQVKFFQSRQESYVECRLKKEITSEDFDSRNMGNTPLMITTSGTQNSGVSGSIIPTLELSFPEWEKVANIQYVDPSYFTQVPTIRKVILVIKRDLT